MHARNKWGTQPGVVIGAEQSRSFAPPGKPPCIVDKELLTGCSNGLCHYCQELTKLYEPGLFLEAICVATGDSPPPESHPERVTAIRFLCKWAQRQFHPDKQSEGPQEHVEKQHETRSIYK